MKKSLITILSQYIFMLTSLFLLLTTLSIETSAQSLASVDLTSIKVDDLSDAQLQEYFQKAEQSGYSQTQLEDLARQRGMPESEIAKLRLRINRLRLSEANKSLTNNFDERNSLSTSEDNVLDLLGANIETLGQGDRQKVFGLELFRSDQLTFAPNLNIPTPSDYILGPGDELVIDFWGATQQYWNLKVSPEGAVRPEGLSPVYVNGLTIEQADKKMISRMAQIYGGLIDTEEQDQNIFYQVSLGNVRTISVTVVGEVAAPGNYSLNSLSTVFTALHAAGGPTEQGTFRAVRLLRDNKLEAEIDLYDFLVDGLRPNDKVLKDGDIIVVKLFKAQIEVTGEVRRPGIYEVKEGDSFEDLISTAGGYTSEAFKAFITVDRNDPLGNKVLNISDKDLDHFQPQDGDLVTIRPNDNLYTNRVKLEGAVKLEGDYQLTEGMTVKSLISKGGGLRGDAFLTRATIQRMNEDFSIRTLAFDLAKLLNSEEPDIELLNEDIVIVSSVYDLREEYYIEINGEVLEEGVYPYFSGMDVEDLILIAGGLKVGAFGAIVEVSRRNIEGAESQVSNILSLTISKGLRLGDNGKEFQLMPFDQVFIRRTPNYKIQQKVTIEGEVKFPGGYALSRKNERVSDIIKRAMGLTQYAYPEGAVLLRKTEFAEKKSDSQLNIEKLKELQDKILKDTTINPNTARKLLNDRLEHLMTKDEGKAQADDRSKARDIVRKELSKSLSQTDSLQNLVVLSEEEPTVLDLVKILENPGSKYDLTLREGDVISIPTKLETVRIAGEIISPLNLRYEPTLSFKDYINDAGGFTSKALKSRSYIQYPSGKKRQTRRFLFFKFYPKVEPGSTIVVSRKPERAPLNFQSIVAAAGSVATLLLVIDRLSN